MKIVVLDVFTVIALSIGQAKWTFLQDGVLTIPESQGKTESTLVITDPQQTILSPAIDTSMSMIVGEGSPGIAISRVILADSAPLPFWQITTPTPPWHIFTIALSYAAVFGSAR